MELDASVLHLQGCVHVCLAGRRPDGIQMQPSNAVAHNISNVIGLSTLTSADVATLSFSPRRGGFPPADCRFHVVFAVGESYFFAADPEVEVWSSGDGA